MSSIYFSRLWHELDLSGVTPDSNKPPLSSWPSFRYATEPFLTNIWCTSRAYYRDVRNWVYPLHDSFYEYEVPPPELYSPSLYGDIANHLIVHLYKYKVVAKETRSWIRAFTFSHQTYDVCDDDPTYTRVVLINILFFLSPIWIALIIYYLSNIYTKWRVWLSIYLSSVGSPLVPSSLYRNAFSNTPMPTVKPIPNHSHGSAAAYRDSATKFASQLAASCGLEPYFYQSSNADQRASHDGYRAWFWSKDASVRPQHDFLANKHLLCFMDVDMYLDMPNFLSTNDNPVLISTFQPHTVAHNDGDYSFTFDRQSTVRYYVSGGAIYEHKVWNYTFDNLMCIKTCFGIPYSARLYLVDRITVCSNHDVILFAPTLRLNFLSILAQYFLSTPVLKRFDLLRGTHHRLLVSTKDGLKMSTGVPNQFVCATIPAHTDDTIANIAANTKSFTRAAIETLLYKDVDSNLTNKETSSTLYDYHLASTLKMTPTEYAIYVVSRFTRVMFNQPTPCRVASNPYVQPTVRRYQFGNYDPDAKPSMLAFMSPLYDGAYAPDKTIGNERRAVEKRITAVASNAKMNDFFRTVVVEFIHHLFPTPHFLVVLDDETVFERQSRPSQRKIIEEADITGNPKRIISTFIKAEAYAKPSDPRLISTYNAVDKVSYSKVIYALSDWMKTLPFYAFSKPPTEVDLCVVRTCSNATTVTATDFSRFDGTISEIGRFFESSLLLRAFRPEYHSLISELHRHQYNLTARCTLGTTYQQGTARGSGSPETSAFNSLYNMFATYLAHRTTIIGSGFILPDSAWKLTQLGLYGGDDGLSVNLDVKQYETACTSIGLNVKANPIKHGNFGITFLGRVYGPDVWKGDTSNCADIPRQLAKLHTTHPRSGVTPEQILVDKMTGFFLTDSNTPIIGPFATKTMFLKGSLIATPEETTWLSRQDVVFNNPPRDWYYEYLHHCLPHFKIDAFNSWVNSVTTLQELLSSPPFIDTPNVPPVDVNVVVDNELVTPKRVKRTPAEKPKSFATSARTKHKKGTSFPGN